jgi:hypothetical protein
MQSLSLERNVADIGVFTRYFSARTRAYSPLLGIRNSRGGPFQDQRL